MNYLPTFGLNSSSIWTNIPDMEQMGSVCMEKVGLERCPFVKWFLFRGKKFFHVQEEQFDHETPPLSFVFHETSL